MTRRIFKSVLAVASVAGLGLVPSCQTGGIGDPCTPEDEFNAAFSGFKVTQENVESRSFQCESRICLVNHFQGRISCPLGQPERTPCAGPDAACPGAGETCTEAGTFAPDCTKDDTSLCGGLAGTCNKGNFCECDPNAGDTACPTGYACDAGSLQCKQYVCFNEELGCQDENATPEQNAGKACCVPGTEIPIAAEVCGQCAEEGGRSAKRAVYCSCRCGVAEGQEEDDNFNFCSCPDGFVCAEVRPDVGIGDPQLAGKYCVKQDDPILTDGCTQEPNDACKVDVAKAKLECGKVNGNFGENCEGEF
jgi:hypothetical protein